MSDSHPSTPPSAARPPVLVVGGGPAGLMAAEALLDAGLSVDLYDAMPSVGRKFLLAGIGGLNITHAEAYPQFCQRYRERETQLRPYLDAFTPDDLREWIHQLGVKTFIGSSGRVFPQEMKAAPLLRAWLARLRRQGLRLHSRHRWLGWQAPGVARFAWREQELVRPYRALVLALGGGSWARLGSDGAWQTLLQAQSVQVHPLRAANCGFHCHWSTHLQERYAGAPLKSVTIKVPARDGSSSGLQRKGELILSRYGLEGSLIYALSAEIRELITQQGSAPISLDLLPDLSPRRVLEALAGRGKQSLSHCLEAKLKLKGVKKALLFERLKDFEQQAGTGIQPNDAQLAEWLKNLPLTLTATAPLDEAISSAGGVCFSQLTPALMLHQLPGVFCAGEMLDWEAPTGGYLLTACFSTGLAAGRGAANYVLQLSHG